VLSIKGECGLNYMERVLNGEISEKNRIHDYEDFIEWYVEEVLYSQVSRHNRKEQYHE